MQAGSSYGYTLLWVITLSTAMLILLQHNAAHLGIVSGYCLSEAIYRYMPRWLAYPALGSAIIAAASTALAEIIGTAIALQLLFHLPLVIGSALTAIVAMVMVFTNSYARIERWIAAFVALVGVSFMIELLLVPTDWGQALVSSFNPQVPPSSMVLIMGVLGAVVMPHNLFLHSEIIQNQRVNQQGEATIRSRLRYEFLDTLFSMGIAWVINSSMLIVAADTFYRSGTTVTDLAQAAALLVPIAGPAAGLLFAVALLFAGLASSITASIAGGTIVSGLIGHHADKNNRITQVGIVLVMGVAWLATLFIQDTFQALILSQTLLSMQLPITVACLLYLTSSRRVMGEHRNHGIEATLLYLIGAVIVVLNIMLIVQNFRP
ncbi:divalent metal cation transporter [Chloroflexia bacterium SDU3-3]|nr:divalent metal cation transporter [Chloroflexia bacterium SDU3-3]